MTLHGKPVVIEDDELKKTLGPILSRTHTFKEVEALYPGLASAAAKACANMEVRRIPVDKLVVKKKTVHAVSTEKFGSMTGPLFEIVPPH